MGRERERDSVCVCVCESVKSVLSVWLDDDDDDDFNSKNTFGHSVPNRVHTNTIDGVRNIVILPNLTFAQIHLGDVVWYTYLPIPPLWKDMTQGQFFKRSITGLNSEFSF